MAKSASDFWKIGENYLIRTVTYHWVGALVRIDENELVLRLATWIANAGRYSTALNDGLETQSDSELEPVPGQGIVLLNRGAIVDAVRYEPPLPRKQK